MAQTASMLDDAAPGRSKDLGWAWGICWLLFASTTLCYMDRQAIALVGPKIKAEFGLGNEDFGWVLAAFGMTYAICQVPAGFLADRRDIRWLYPAAVVWWSLAGAAAAFAPSLAVLLVFRAMLGVGESFNWPCALRVTGSILPPSERSLGNGIFNSGAAVGAVLTPLIVPPLTDLYGWRTAFVVVAALGLVWVGVWSISVRGPRAARMLGGPSAKPEAEAGPDEIGPMRRSLSTPARLAFGGLIVVATLIALSTFQNGPTDLLGRVAFRGRSAPSWMAPLGPSAIWCGIAFLMVGLLLVALALPRKAVAGSDWAESLGAVVRLRRFWVLVVVSSTINVCWHFLINWLPTYLKEDRGMTFLASGIFTALPFLAADFGNLGGGFASRYLVRGGLTPARARVRVMALCTLLITSGAWVGIVESNALTIGLLAIMAFGTAAFMANYFAFCQEVSGRYTGLIVGILGGLGNLFAAGFLPFAGRVKDVRGDFSPIFVMVGLLPFLGLGVLALGWGRDEVETAAVAEPS